MSLKQGFSAAAFVCVMVITQQTWGRSSDRLLSTTEAANTRGGEQDYTCGPIACCQGLPLAVLCGNQENIADCLNSQTGQFMVLANEDECNVSDPGNFCLAFGSSTTCSAYCQCQWDYTAMTCSYESEGCSPACSSPEFCQSGD